MRCQTVPLAKASSSFVNLWFMSSSPEWQLGPHLLNEVSYPIDKVALLDRAMELGLPSAVQEAIRRLPTEPFGSRDELVAAVEGLTSL